MLIFGSMILGITGSSSTSGRGCPDSLRWSLAGSTGRLQVNGG